MFHPDLRLLRCFVAVADERSVTKAAERLHLTQPTISGQIKDLERAIGHPLFHRTTRSIKLSYYGDKLLPLAKSVMDQVHILRNEVEIMQSAERLSFRLGAAIYSIDIPERMRLLEDFAEFNPNVSYSIDNRMQHAQIRDLLNERLGVAMLLGISAPASADGRGRDELPTTNETQYPDTLERVVLRRRPIDLLVPKDSPLAKHTVIPHHALKGEKVATLTHDHGSALTVPIEKFLQECGAVPVFPAEGNAMAVERYAERHNICAIGVGWFPERPGLLTRRVEGMEFFLDFSVVIGSGANLAAGEFFAFAKRWARNNN